MSHPIPTDDPQSVPPARRSGNASTDESPAEPAPARILVVDDEPTVREVLQLFLQRRGHSVTPAANGEAGLRQFRDAPQAFDMVVTDLRMPEFTGLELAAALLKIRPGLPILLLSGFGDDALKDRALAAGVGAFLAKPVTQRDLAAAVERLLLARGRPN